MRSLFILRKLVQGSILGPRCSTDRPASKPVSKPGSKPASQPASQPVSQASQPAKQPASQASQQVSQQSSQAAYQPASKPASEPASRPASQQASQPAGKPFSISEIWSPAFRVQESKVPDVFPPPWPTQILVHADPRLAPAPGLRPRGQASSRSASQPTPQKSFQMDVLKTFLGHIGKTGFEKRKVFIRWIGFSPGSFSGPK